MEHFHNLIGFRQAALNTGFRNKSRELTPRCGLRMVGASFHPADSGEGCQAVFLGWYRLASSGGLGPGSPAVRLQSYLRTQRWIDRDWPPIIFGGLGA